MQYNEYQLQRCGKLYQLQAQMRRVRDDDSDEWVLTGQILTGVVSVLLVALVVLACRKPSHKFETWDFL